MDHDKRPTGKLLWRPDDFKPDRPPRRVSWLELFHDLVYVVAVSQLTHGLLLAHGASDFLLFTLLFGLVLWSWMKTSRLLLRPAREPRPVDAWDDVAADGLCRQRGDHRRPRLQRSPPRVRSRLLLHAGADHRALVEHRVVPAGTSLPLCSAQPNLFVLCA